MRIAYQSKKLAPKSLAIVREAEAICSAYAAQGYDLTLRQLYYQFVSRGLLANKDANYKRLGSIVNDARLSGYLDWDYIVDRTRNIRGLAHWENPAEIIEATARSFRHELWKDQPERVEVWIEKDALTGVIEGVCQRNDVDFFSCRGYTSQSEMWSAAQRLRAYVEAGQAVTVLHLGDHDPSGIDMTRDIQERLNLFVLTDIYQGNEVGGSTYADVDRFCERVFGCRGRINVERIALNMDQVEEYDPPPNPAKLTDARAQGYIAEHGHSSWELDALEPTVLDALIEGHIQDHRDPDLWAEAKAVQTQERRVLSAVSERWGEVAEYLAD